MKKILFVVDLQQEFGLEVDPERYYNILEFVQNAKSNGYYMVIATKCKNRPDSNFVKSGVWTECLEGVQPLNFKPDILFNKYAYGLGEYQYARLDKDYEYHIVGYNTDACILKVALDLFDRKFNLRVLKDYCYSSLGESQHQLGIKILTDLIGNYVI